MADTMLIKRGSAATTLLLDGELGYSRTEKALYIGDNGVNQKLTFPAMESQEELSEDSDIAAVRTAYNSLISALKASGMMK